MAFPITNQADLYYRNQTPNPGANSGNRVYPSEGKFAAQPYIIRDIGQRWGFGLGFDEGLVRGGIVTLADRTANDVIRLTKFSLDLPKGPLFYVKQIGLQLMNPRMWLAPNETPAATEQRALPSIPSGGSGGGGSRNTVPQIGNIRGESTLRPKLTSTQLFNPLSTLVNTLTSPFGIHLQRHGIPFVSNDYVDIAGKNNEGISFGDPALKGIDDVKWDSWGSLAVSVEERGVPLNDSTKSRLVNLYGNHILYNDGYKLNAALIEYPTGPGSMLGIGSTTIRRYENTRLGVRNYIDNYENKIIEVGNSIKNSSPFNIEGIDFYATEDEKNKTGIIETRITAENSVRSSAQSGLLNDVTSSKSIELNSFGTKSPLLILASSSLGSNFDQDEIDKTGDIRSRITSQKSALYDAGKDENDRWGVAAFTYDQIKDALSGSLTTKDRRSSNNVRDFRKVLNLSGAEDYPTFNIHKRINVAENNGVEGSGVDKINVTDIYKVGAQNDIAGNPLPNPGWIAQRDLVKFSFESINNDNPKETDVMVFRAYINNFKDSIDAKWNSVKYIGRAEDFYTYEGFNRKISVDFNIFAHSRQEMKPLYRKLLYLFSQTAPDLSAGGKMRAPLMRLTIGNWFYRLPGFITSIGTSVDGKETPWEIALNQPEGGTDVGMLELPKLLTISLSYTPIHDFTPKKGSPSQLTPFLFGKNNNWLKP